MQIAKTLVSALTGTSAMTLFSYLVSRSENRNYREPQVLGQLINRLPITLPKKYAHIAGWGAHYATGVAFEVLYTQLWKQKILKPSLASGALLGAASGLAGIMVWKGIFKTHPNAPPKNLKKYFSHLVLAHVVFGVFSALTYKTTVAEKNP